MAKHTHTNPTRVGIDFGGTIGFVDQAQPVPFALEIITHLIHKFHASNVFIVSKAGPAIMAKTQEWFQQHQFLERTGFLRENVIFVRECVDKAEVVRSLGISIFLDDSLKVVRCLAPLSCVDRIFWLGAKAADIQLIDKEHRRKVAISKGWANSMKYFQRIRREKTDKAGETGERVATNT